MMPHWRRLRVGAFEFFESRSSSAASIISAMSSAAALELVDDSDLGLHGEHDAGVPEHL